jgi:2-polyprenyl-3-methyl-5-hydroxy-6-metoxy-1,4-benzoquinol methylase
MDSKGTAYIKTCPIGCESRLVDTDIVVREGPFKRCSACGQLVSGCSEGTFERTMQEFDTPAGTWPSTQGLMRQKKRARHILDVCQRYTGKARHSMHLLDVGCSSGAFVYAAQMLGVAAEGVEPSPKPVQTAQAHGLKVYQGFLEDLGLPAGSYHVTTLMEVVEHLIAPLKLLRECHRLLAPGGMLVIKTGNTGSWSARWLKARWEYYDISKHGGHISFFNPRSMNLMAERTGFQTVRITTRKTLLYDKQSRLTPSTQFLRLFSNLLSRPAGWFGSGHEMLVFLQKLSDTAH